MPFRYVENYISEEDFNGLQNIGINYEGFIVGVGYAYVTNESFLSPDNPNMGKYSRFYYKTVQVQQIDTSYESVKRSLKNQNPFADEVERVLDNKEDENIFDEVLSRAITPLSITVGMHQYHIAKNINYIRPIFDNNGTFWSPPTIARDLKTGAPYKGAGYEKYVRTKRRIFVCKGLGFGLAGIGLYYSGKDYLNGNISGKRFALDLIFTGIGFAGPLGLLFSTSYFMLMGDVQHRPTLNYMANPFDDYNQSARPDKTKYYNPYLLELDYK